MNNLKVETFLPIGSVVMLKEANQELMITGFCVAQEIDGKQVVYDYLGCLWPMGVIDTNKNFVFNHEEIGEVIFKGLENETELAHKKQLEKLVKDIEEALAKQSGVNNG